MENLYDNLENYEDENIVSELRKENAELKCKLEEYSKTLEKLQKNILQDFDKVSTEFKKLEINYSSLLKTAKQEIERKTHIISQLNKEKDIIVLNTVQNKNVADLRRNRYTATRNQSSDLEKSNHTKSEGLRPKDPSNNERDKRKHFPSEETTTTASTDNLNNCLSKNVDRLSNACQDERKENIAKDDTVKPMPLNISNRRKSMPALREAKFSSDEEEDRNYCAAGTKFQKTDHDPEPPYISKKHYDKNRLLDDRYRTSETSSMDDKYSGYHKYNKDLRNRISRYDNSKNRSRDQPKYRRHFSPERTRRYTRNYFDDHESRQEFRRHRVLESPSPDRSHNYQRWNRDIRSRYDNEYYDHDKIRARHQENYVEKHKISNDNEEPLNKRRRTDSFNNREEGKRWNEDRVPIQTSVTVEEINQMYCQSPDYPYMPEISLTQPIREIRHTAVTQLEDPRQFSKRYVLYQGDNVISAITGRNNDLKVIDTSCWDMRRVEVPRALTRRPSQCSEDIARNVCIDIENPISNMSLESGEIVGCERDDLETSDKEQPFHHKHYKCDHVSTKNTAPEKISTSKDVNLKKFEGKQDAHTLNEDSTHKEDKNRFDKCNTPEQPLYSLAENVHENFSNEKQQNNLDRVNEIDTQKLEKKSSNLGRKHMVEGDLELSDETNDNVDIQKKFMAENDIHIMIKDVPKANKSSEQYPFEVNKSSAVLDLETNPMALTSEDTKKSKCKRKSQKGAKKDAPVKEDSAIPREKKTKSKKETKEIKTKFSELFGDTTSSLITPDDLGIPTSQSQIKYFPICEDAQDAVILKPVEMDNTSHTVISNDVNNIDSAENIDIENKTELPKCKSDTVIDNKVKKKKSKKKETEKAVSSNHTETQFEPTCDYSSEEVRKDMLKCQNDVCIVDETQRTNELQNVILQKPDLLLKALATSTPHKEMKDNPVELPITITSNQPSTLNCENNFVHNVVVSVDDNNIGKDNFSSNNETLDSQTEVDTPDVRIFVKRRRKIMRKTKPS